MWRLSVEIHSSSWEQELLVSGDYFLGELEELVTAADPDQLVGPKPRYLCAALGLLSQVCYDALGGVKERRGVGRVGALLSLLTKIDDQVIDDLGFHCGTAYSYEDVADRTRAYLDPTLNSILTGRAVNGEARCFMAATLGRELGQLAGSELRLRQVLNWISEGWAIQVRAVATLSRHGSAVTVAQVEDVTRDISGAWLLMIAAIGTLPEDVDRGFTRDEESGFFDWGWHIQRADALADMAKDLGDGLISSYPDRLLYDLDREAYEGCVSGASRGAVYEICRRLDLDRLCLPGAGEIEGCQQRLSGLGRVPSLLRWIHGFLTWRYLVHPLCQRSLTDPLFAPFVRSPDQYESYVIGVFDSLSTVEPTVSGY
jgi:hypothetical protein